MISADPEKTVLSWRGTAFSAAEFTHSVRSAAHALHRHTEGGKAPVVAVLTTTNTPATLLLRYAANLAGATVVHLHTTNAVDPDDRLTADAELRILKETDATVLAVDADHLDVARRLRDRMPTPLALAGLGPLGPDVLDLTTGDAAVFDPAGIEIDPERTAVVTYTSGTTGRPKGIAVDFRTRGWFISAGLKTGYRAAYLATLPMSHSSGATTDDSLASGGTVFLHDGFEPGAVLSAVEHHRISRLLISPPQLYQLLDHPRLSATDLSSLQMLCYTGCPASPERLAEAVKVFGAALIQVYGTSEAGAVTILMPPEHADAELRRTAGRPLLGEVRIVGPDGTAELPAGEIGEICVRSPLAMRGYVADPGLTARTLVDGWLHTGDLGRFDDRGYLHIHGRMADVIKANGIKVHPTAVENALLTHEDVVQAAVFGTPDEDRVEHIHATVVLRDGATATTAGLREHVTAALTPNHAPARIDIRAELPLTGIGKPDRARLAADARKA
ncbi:AMP-binding protein [Streptomyces sp. NPDC052051]|uniref:AMP-binding protein n=1 Tax=Streptomyces sp. NPDC052051 TaxID=3154649 RepID=UPI00342EB964